MKRTASLSQMFRGGFAPRVMTGIRSMSNPSPLSAKCQASAYHEDAVGTGRSSPL